MYEDFILIQGKKPGPTSIILAGVHGNETCGIEAFKKLLPILKIDTGEVWFGYGNPKAMEQKVRFTETNLNRLFQSDDKLSEEEKSSYEYERAQFIKNYLDKADALLDIHASNTPDSTPFIICEPNATELTKYLPFKLKVSGFDNIQPGGTDFYMNRIGKIGICIECGYLDDSASTERAEKSIMAFLVAQGHIMSNLTIVAKQEEMNLFQLYVTQSDSFILTKQFKDFQEVAKNELIGMDGSAEVRAPKNSFIVFARNRHSTGDEGFVLAEKKSSLA